MKISKAIAKQAASALVDAQLTATDGQTPEAMMAQVADGMRTVYLNKLTSSVRSAFVENPTFFRTVTKLEVDVPGFGKVTFDTDVIPLNEGGQASIGLDGKTDGVLIGQYATAVKALAKSDDLKAEATAAIETLRTYGNVEALFPEAYDYLPNPTPIFGQDKVDAFKAKFPLSASESSSPIPAKR